MAREAIVGEVNVQAVDAADDGSALVRLDIFHPAPLRIAVAERAKVIDLAEEEWADAGVYLLLERPSQDGTWSTYVGKSAAAGGVKKRLRLHLRDPDKSTWYRAIAVCPTDAGWDEADVAFLEGSVYRTLSELPGVSLSNAQVPGSGRLAENRRMRLHKVPEILTGLLALIGHPGVAEEARQDDRPEPPDLPVVKKPIRPGKLAGLLQGGLVDVGTKLVTVDPRWPSEGIITANGDIDLAGEVHSSPSAAAKAVSGRKAESGWDFWAVRSQQGPTLNQLRDQLASTLISPVAREPDQGTDLTQSAENEDRPNRELGDAATRERAEADTPVASPRDQRVQLSDLIASGLLPVGASVVSTSRKWPAKGIVTSDGRIEISGDTFDNPSAAARAVVGGGRRNGWLFWALDGPQGERLAEVRERFTSSRQAT